MDVKQEVGACAGDVYKLLSQRGKAVPMAEVVKGVNKDRRVVIAAVGWLMREDRIDVQADGTKMTVKLR